MILYDFIYGKSGGKDERYINVLEAPEDIIGDTAQQRMRERFVIGRFLNAMWIKVCRRCIVDINTDYEPYAHVANGEDMLQSMALFDAAKSFAHINKALVYYRRDNVSMSKGYSIRDYYSFRTGYCALYKYAARWNFDEGQVNIIRVKALNKCMAILGQVRASKDTNEYRRLLILQGKDDFFRQLKAATNANGMPIYYRLMYLCIVHGNLLGVYLLNKLMDLKHRQR